MATHIDLEGRSIVDLKRVGGYRYAEDPGTKITLGSVRHGDLPVYHWRPGDPLIRETGLIVAHNAGFERTMLRAAGYDIHPEEQDCTLARAAALSLPTPLDQCCEVLKAPQQKDKDGKRLMLRMCKADYEPKPGEMERLQAYCDQDVLAECALDKLLPPLSERERRVWILDQHVNDRGFAIDVPLAVSAQEAVTEAKRLADRRMWELTEGAVGKCTEAARICAWLRGRDIPCDSIAEGEIDDLICKTSLLDDPLAAEVVRLRISASRTFKFPAMLDCVCRDGRIRGALAYHGTLSGRWAGRLVQPQNMKRIETEDDERVVASTIEILAAGMDAPRTLDWLGLIHENPLEALSLCARPMIIAGPGKKLIGGDFSNIEGRINAWLNGEAWKLQAFQEYDAGDGPDLYRVTAGGILGKAPEDVRKEERQIWGKVSELACGYQGGVNAFNKMGANYGVSVENSQAKAIVTGWRAQNPGIVLGWADLQQSAIEAVSAPGVIVSALGGKVAYRMDKGFLWCCLPSGRVLAYPGAIVERKHKVVVIDGEEVEFDNWGVSYWTGNGHWHKEDLYGGRQMAHVVSGTARDILVEAMFRLEAASYPIVLTVHDETLSEVARGFGSAADYRRLMEIRELWFADVPITAKTWEGLRYEH